MSIIAIIPSRSGSKRLPDKNRLEINGEPLYKRAIRTAEESGIFDEIFLSTDDKEMEATGHVTLYRPAPLHTDRCNTAAIIFDCLATIGYYPDSFCVLNPSSPCRTPELIKRLYDQFEREKFQCLWTSDDNRSHNGDCLFWRTADFVYWIGGACIAPFGVRVLTDGIDINTSTEYEIAKKRLEK